MATTDNLVKVSQLQTALTRVKSELDTLDGKTFALYQKFPVGTKIVVKTF